MIHLVHLSYTYTRRPGHLLPLAFTLSLVIRVARSDFFLAWTYLRRAQPISNVRPASWHLNPLRATHQSSLSFGTIDNRTCLFVIRTFFLVHHRSHFPLDLSALSASTIAMAPSVFACVVVPSLMIGRAYPLRQLSLLTLLKRGLPVPECPSAS